MYVRSKSSISKHVLGTPLFSIKHQYSRYSQERYGHMLQTNIFQIHLPNSTLFLQYCYIDFKITLAIFKFNNMQ